MSKVLCLAAVLLIAALVLLRGGVSQAAFVWILGCVALIAIPLYFSTRDRSRSASRTEELAATTWVWLRRVLVVGMGVAFTALAVLFVAEGSGKHSLLVRGAIGLLALSFGVFMIYLGIFRQGADLGTAAKLVLELKPLEGFGPIKLGSAREEVRAAMATLGFLLESSQAEIDRFCGSSIQAEFQDGRLSFIGVFYSDAFVAKYRGVDVFDVTAPELFQMAAAADDSGHHEFDHLEYRFPNQILTLWHADPQYDYRRKGKRQIWGEIGLGNEAYMSAIKALEDDA